MSLRHGTRWAASLVLGAVLAFGLAAPSALADNVVDGYPIHWTGTGSTIAVCPQGDTLSASGPQVTCYLPTGEPDPTKPWVGTGVTSNGSGGRLLPPQGAASAAPWMQTLISAIYGGTPANCTGVAGPSPIPGASGAANCTGTVQDVVTNTINGWVDSAMNSFVSSLAGFFGTLDNMPMLHSVPMVVHAYDISVALALFVILIRVILDLRGEAAGRGAAFGTAPTPWGRYLLVGAVIIGGLFAMDLASVIMNQVIDGLWVSVFHLAHPPSGFQMLQYVGGGSANSAGDPGAVFPQPASLSAVAGGILFVIVGGVLLVAVGVLVMASVLVWLFLGAFSPLLALWGVWRGGLESDEAKRLLSVATRTFGFHSLMALFWLFLYGGTTVLSMTMGFEGSFLSLLALTLAVAGSVFYWVVPVARALAGGEAAGSSSIEQWANAASKVLTRVGAATGNAKIGALGTSLSASAGRAVQPLRTAAYAMPDIQHDTFSIASTGAERVNEYEHAISDPTALVRWVTRVEPDGDRHIYLEGHPGAVEHAMKEFKRSAAFLAYDPNIGLPLADARHAQMQLATAMSGAEPYWHSSVGLVSVRGGMLVKIKDKDEYGDPLDPVRGIDMGNWGSPVSGIVISPKEAAPPDGAAPPKKAAPPKGPFA